ncbi:alpha/beta fold hydrolase [Streptomyces sp. NPDC008150]|uniref:alpha/beta hydrolase n=1 Tax=Streptomyces sp. NPDC008150 TaxID=3364816 RepID=UPI0036E3A266
MPALLSPRTAAARCAYVGAVALSLLSTGLPTAVAEDQRPDLSRFYRQHVTWAACEGPDMPADLQCGKVTVPLDYARPKAGTLDLAMARYRGTGRSHASVLLNFGGPGGSGVDGLAAGGKDFMDLTNGYDVVSFDPRGVGRSSPVTCGDAAADAWSGTDDTGADNPRAMLEQLRTAARECAANSGPVLRHIGTVNAARDLDVMRAALGDKKLNYLGFSYGTRLGAVYAAQFPKKVGRFALDGVDTLTEPLSEQGRVGAQGQQAALEDFLKWCTRDVGCPFGQDTRSAREQVVRLVRSLDANPVPSDFGDDFTGQDLVGAISQALYSEELWPSLERALASLVEDGDTNGAEGFTSGGSRVPGLRASGAGTAPAPWAPAPRHTVPKPSGVREDGGLTDAEDVPPDNLPAALMAINCADDPDRPGADRIAAEYGRLRAEYERASPVFGRYRLTEVLMCYGRPRGTDFVRDDVRNVATPHMLLVGTRGDPATPYRWTTETAKRLGPSAVVLDNRGDGHTGYASSKCVHRKVDDFLLYGSLPPSGSSCAADTDDSTATAGE